MPVLRQHVACDGAFHLEFVKKFGTLPEEASLLGGAILVSYLLNRVPLWGLLLVLSGGPAKAGTPIGGGGGSLFLGDILHLIKADPALLSVISGEPRPAGQSLEEVLCDGRRFHHNFPALDGMRVGPYYCTFATRSLEVRTSLKFHYPDGHTADERTVDGLLAEEVKEKVEGWRWMP